MNCKNVTGRNWLQFNFTALQANHNKDALLDYYLKKLLGIDSKFYSAVTTSYFLDCTRYAVMPLNEVFFIVKKAYFRVITGSIIHVMQCKILS